LRRCLCRDRIQHAVDLGEQLRPVNLADDVDHPGIEGRWDDSVRMRAREGCIGRSFHRAGGMAAWHCNETQEGHFSAFGQAQLMPKPLFGVGTVAELHHCEPVMRKMDLGEIQERRARAPGAATFCAIALSPAHIGCGHPLGVAAGMAVEAVVRVVLWVGADAGPAVAERFVLFACDKAGLAAQLCRAPFDAIDECELPPHNMPAPRPKYSIMAIQRVAFEKDKSCGFCKTVLARGGAAAAPWLGRAQIEHFAGSMCPADRALEGDVIPVADTSVDPKPFLPGDLGPGLWDWRRVGGPDICGQVL